MEEGTDIFYIGRRKKTLGTNFNVGVEEEQRRGTGNENVVGEELTHPGGS